MERTGNARGFRGKRLAGRGVCGDWEVSQQARSLETSFRLCLEASFIVVARLGLIWLSFWL